MVQHRRIDPVVATKRVTRRADGVVCVITASDFDPGVYTEVVPGVGVAKPPSKRERERDIMRGVYHHHHDV